MQIITKSSNTGIKEYEHISIQYANMLNDFIQYLDVLPATVHTYTMSLRQLFKYLTSKGISNPTRETLIDFKRSLENAGYKSTTIALYLAAARRFFTWCDLKGLYPNIAMGIKAPRIAKGHKKDSMNGLQVKQVINSVDRHSLEGKRNYAVLALMATCGLRTIEIVRANIEDLRCECGVMVLFVQGKGKTDKADFVKVSEPVMNAILEYLTARGKVEDSAPLFASCSRRNFGQRLTTRTVSGVAKRAMIHAGYNSTRLTAHSFRHSAVTLAILAGNSIYDVQSFARHSSINTTMIYNHSVNRINSLCELSVSNAIFS